MDWFGHCPQKIESHRRGEFGADPYRSAFRQWRHRCLTHLYLTLSPQKAKVISRMPGDWWRRVVTHVKQRVLKKCGFNCAIAVTKKSGQHCLHGKLTASCLTPPDHHPDGVEGGFTCVEFSGKCSTSGKSHFLSPNRHRWAGLNQPN
jgi:hypothetical protein